MSIEDELRQALIDGLRSQVDQERAEIERQLAEALAAYVRYYVRLARASE